MSSSTTTTKIQTPSPTTPGQAATTTTRTEAASFRYNNVYLHTVPGFLKAACMVFTLVGFLCVQFSAFSGTGSAQFFSTIAMLAFWFTGILLVFYLFDVIYVLNKIPWNQIEFYFCAGATILLMISSAIITGTGVGLFTIAGFCGFIAMCAYGYDTFLKYRDFNTITTVVTRTTTVTVA